MKKLKIALLAFLLFSAGYLTSAEITDLSVTDASNTARFPENMAPSSVNNAARALEGLLARWEKDTNASVVAYGTGNAIRVTPNRTISSLYDGLVMAVELTAANTGAATFQISSLSATTIKKNHDEDVASGDFEAGQKIVVVYNSDEAVFQLIGGGKATGPSAGDGISVSGSTVSVAITNGIGLALSQSKLRLDINGMTTQAISGTDTFPHYNATASEARKISGGSILGLVTALPSATPVTSDTIAFADASDGNAAKQTSINTLLGLQSPGFTLAAEVATTSGTSVTLGSSIPAGTTQIDIMLEGVSINGSGELIIQIGDAGGVETSGYDGLRHNAFLATPELLKITAGFPGMAVNATGETFTGVISLYLKDSANFTWLSKSTVMNHDDDEIGYGVGVKSLSAELTSVFLTTVVGTAAFDAGSASIKYIQ